MFLIFLTLIYAIISFNITTLQQLAVIDHQIQMELQKIDKFLSINKVFEKYIAISSQQSQYFSLPSILYPAKDTTHYPLIISNQQIYYTVDGNLITNFTSVPHFYQSSKNDQTIFVVQNKKQAQIYKLQFQQGKLQLIKQLQINLKKQWHNYIDFTFQKYSSQRKYIFSTKDGQIEFYDHEGQLYHQINIGQPIQLYKLNHQLIAFTTTSIYLLIMESKAAVIKKCMSPFQQSVIEIKFDDYYSKRFIAIMKDKIYIYETIPTCKPILTYNIPLNSSLYSANEAIFIFAGNLHYYINTTDNQVYNSQIPFTKCRSLNESFSIIKKSVNLYMIIHLCQNQSQLHSQYMSIEMAQILPQSMDLGKFRIPFIILSFGVILYMSFKRKKQNIVDPQQFQSNNPKTNQIRRGQLQKLLQQLKKKQNIK